MPIVVVAFRPLATFLLRWRDATTNAIVRTEEWEAVDSSYQYPSQEPRETTSAGLSIVRQTFRPEPRAGRLSASGSMLDAAQAARIEGIFGGYDRTRSWWLDKVEFEDPLGMAWKLAPSPRFHSECPEGGGWPRFSFDGAVESAPSVIFQQPQCNVVG